MSYSDLFSSQWDNLVQSFLSDTEGHSSEMLTLNRVNAWYQANSFRWCSVVEKEGILLRQENSPALAAALTSEIQKFHFQSPDLPGKPCAPAAAAAGAGAALVIALTLKFAFSPPIWVVVLGAGIGMLGALIWYAYCLDRYAQKSRAALIQGYADQLTKYKDHLLEVCSKFEQRE